MFFNRIPQDWGSYFQSPDGKPALINVNIGLDKVAPMKGYKYIHEFMLDYNSQENGLPTPDENDKLWIIQELMTKVTSKSNGIAAGSVKINGNFVFFGYFKAKDGIKDKILKVVNEKYPEYNLFHESSEDEKWEKYKDFLYPDKYSLQEITNGRICTALLQKNDDLKKARVIEHFLLFKNIDNAKIFANKCKENGFEIVSIDSIKGDSYSSKLCISHVFTPIDINQVTWDLMDLAESLEGSYDGWGCFTNN